MRTLAIALTLAMSVSALAAAPATYPAEAREAIRQNFAHASSLNIDTVVGSITVTGDTGDTVRIEGEKIIRALDDSELGRARREVVLNVSEKDGVAQLYVDGPFRHGGNADRNKHPGYEVTYNFVVRVPRRTTLRLHTVNGEIRADDTAGAFDLKTINGGIAMNNAAGSGSADALNGSTVVKFRENPQANSFFKSFNGLLDVRFQPSLSADLRLKTFNGQAYTDFDVNPLPSTAAIAKGTNGKFVYRADRFRALRVGAGGPEIRLETFNGDIRIRK